ncbi:hypothetical protein [Actinospica robiniae]|uniref:hypothetical protein n=1 Tax=Actinospica robiniae TaxID=304901 RepID=UPI0003F4CA04|nr:hypothetical protein [Actinospica robiniae]
MNSAIAGRFPLMSRPRPLGLPLPARIAALAEPLLGAEGVGHHEQVAHASSVINLASLIASDVGLDGLAWEMCWKHYGLFAGARRLENPATAVMAVQPLMNIARLLTRHGDGRDAYEALEQLYQAAKTRSVAEVCGRTVDVSAIIRSPEGHRKIAAELWAAVVTDGIRALTRVGEWAEAARAAAEHKGVGKLLWEGRQATILALLERGLTADAAAMVESSEISNAPQKAVASVLRAFCALEAGSADTALLEGAVAEALAIAELHMPPTAVFRTHLALAALALADVADARTDKVARLREAVIATAHTDAYAARAVASALGDETGSLRLVVESCGLGQGSIASELLEPMMNSVAEAESRLHDLLGTRACSDVARADFANNAT